MNKRLVPLLIFPLLAGVPPARASEPGNLELSGFLTLTAGKILGGRNNDTANALGYDGPSMPVDFANNGTYEAGDGWTLAPNSKLGLQGSLRLGDHLSLTGQAVVRGARAGEVDLGWLYANIRLGDDLTLQLGRKRLPLFYYSETQDVGLSYPWVHLPQALYGWEIVNYNGGSLMYRTMLGDWHATANLFAGTETRKDNPFWEYYEGKGAVVDSRWSGIRGLELNLGRDWFEGRLVYITSGEQNRFVSDGETAFGPVPAPTQHIYGLALNADYGDWVVRSEAYYIDRRENDEEDSGYLLGLGRRFGDWLPMVTYAYYRLDSSVEANRERFSNLSFLLRWDVSPSSALKIQYDRWLDHSAPAYKDTTPFAGADLISVSYDRVF